MDVSYVTCIRGDYKAYNLLLFEWIIYTRLTKRFFTHVPWVMIAPGYEGTREIFSVAYFLDVFMAG